MVTAICAWLRRCGVRVAPFKAQNMSNNSYPCAAGGEIGRAQVAQAWACGLEPEPAMNPVLLKPTSQGASQVVVNGKMWKTLSAREYYAEHDALLEVVLNAYQNLASRFDVVVIEGAGSVTELNLRQYDLVNLGLANRLSAPWLLVADIERGGIFASVIGTVGLLSQEERTLLRAFAVNKFRGDRSLFDVGRQILEERTGCPCLGVFPYTTDIHLHDEDTLGIPGQQTGLPTGGDCAIIRLPHISNTTDFALLRDACWLTRPVDRDFRFIFLPGTKNTVSDLEWVRAQGLERWLRAQYDRGATLIGICGGFQMLGETITDPGCIESKSAEIRGLAFLPATTCMKSLKTTQVVRAVTPGGYPFTAYEIHVGETTFDRDAWKPFAILENGSPEGLRGNRIIGTYLHGAFENQKLLEEIGISASAETRPGDFALLADWFEPFSQRFNELFALM
jgi:adenosylcobyric acid synthase